MVEIEIIERIGFDELVGLLRNIPLNGQTILPYREADISLRVVNPREINPTTKYLLRGNLSTQEGLRAGFLENGIDIFLLDAAYKYRSDGGEWMIIPPVVETMHRSVGYFPGNGEIDYSGIPHRILIPAYCDGQHRAFLAIGAKSKLAVLYISDISEDYPFYAHPGSWEDVELYDCVPSTLDKKKSYLRKNPVELYRDFSSLTKTGFRGVGGG